MTGHSPDLGSTSVWSCRVGNLLQPIRSTTQIWVVTRHQYGISVLVSQTSYFAGKLISGGVAKCQLFLLKLAPGVQISVRLEQAQLQVGAVKYSISLDSVMPLSQRFSLCSHRWPRLEIWPPCCLTFDLNIRICTREKPKKLFLKPGNVKGFK